MKIERILLNLVLEISGWKCR